MAISAGKCNYARGLMIYWLIFFLFSLCGCGYHFEGGEKISISVPYVEGDLDGSLTDAIVRTVSTTPQYRFSHGIGDWTLKVVILGATDNRIGFKYDRDFTSGILRKNLIAVENRKEVTAQVTLINNCTGKILFGPKVVKADGEYDYYDPNSLQDVSLEVKKGVRESSIGFSLGQLDSIEGAQSDVYSPTYVALAKKIVDGLIIFNKDEP